MRYMGSDQNFIRLPVSLELGIKGNLSENLKYKTQQGAMVIDDEISEIWLLCINV